MAATPVPGTTYAYDSSNNSTLNTQRASGMPWIGANGDKLPITTTNVNVYANGMRVGFVQTFNPSESRTITKVNSLGYEGVVQSVANNTTGGQISLSRLSVYNATLYNVLGLTQTGQFQQLPLDTSNSVTRSGAPYNTFANPFKTLKDQRVPLEFKTQVNEPAGGNSATYTITYIDCWLSTFGKTVATSAITITETATVLYSDIVSDYVTD